MWNKKVYRFANWAIERKAAVRFSNVKLIAGGEQPTTKGPKPYTPAELELAVRAERAKVLRLARKQAPRGPDNGPESLSRLGKILEFVIVDWLSQHAWLSTRGFLFDARRTLHFEREDAGQHSTESRELDGLIVDRRGRPRIIVEVRVSVQGMRAVHQKHVQLHESLRIMRSHEGWEKVKALLVFVKVGKITLPSEHRVRTQPSWLVAGHHFRMESLPAAFEKNDVAQLVLPFEAVWQHADEQGWELCPRLRKNARRYAKVRYQRRLRAYEQFVAAREHVVLDLPAALPDSDSLAI